MAAVPMLVQLSVKAFGGYNPRCFGRKRLTKSDCISKQNRFMFRTKIVKNFILPQLSEAEQESAHLPLGFNLNDDPNRSNQGLPVDLYMINRLENFQTLLIRRATKGVVLKGKGWKRVVEAGNFAPGDGVRLWSFRKVENDKLCLLIQKME